MLSRATNNILQLSAIRDILAESLSGFMFRGLGLKGLGALDPKLRFRVLNPKPETLNPNRYVLGVYASSHCERSGRNEPKDVSIVRGPVL